MNLISTISNGLVSAVQSTVNTVTAVVSNSIDAANKTSEFISDILTDIAVVHGMEDRRLQIASEPNPERDDRISRDYRALPTGIFAAYAPYCAKEVAQFSNPFRTYNIEQYNHIVLMNREEQREATNPFIRPLNPMNPFLPPNPFFAKPDRNNAITCVFNQPTTTTIAYNSNTPVNPFFNAK